MKHPRESERLEELDAMEILDTPSEERFDRITRLAQQVFGTEIALVSLVDQNRQWFKSAQGLAATETDRSVSFCTHAVAQNAVLIVEDARQDDRFRANPLVTGDPEIRFYAGVPLLSQQGLPMGTLCVIGSAPREFNAKQLQSLEDLASIVQEEMRYSVVTEAARRLLRELKQTERRLVVDPLTRIWRREHILNLAEMETLQCKEGASKLSLCMVDIDDFGAVNKCHGHQKGDAVLADVAQMMRRAVRGADAIGRYGGEEFLVLFPDTALEGARAIAERIRQSVTRAKVCGIEVTLSIGVAEYQSGKKISETIANADAALMRAKKLGKNRVEST